MDRILEPEVMDDPEQVLAYAQADFTVENQGFVDKFLELYPDLGNGLVMDMGCGPGDIPIRLARSHPTCRVVGIDASAPMIAFAEKAVQDANLQDRISFLCHRVQDLNLPQLPDALVSNSLLHHLPNPLRFWYSVKMLVKPGSPVLIMDLLRPESPEDARAIVDHYAGNEAKRLQEDFYHSLLAAFTEDEVASQLAELNLSRLMVDVPDDRHWVVYGRVS